jgi:P-type E1-E2 ATPase
LIFITQCVFLLIKIWISPDTSLLQIDTLVKILDFFTTALAIIIVAVPEGLPLAVSLSVAFSMDAMKSDNLLVKKNEAFETMGMVNQICTGKTATLTNNKMNVNCYYTCGKFIDRMDDEEVSVRISNRDDEEA